MVVAIVVPIAAADAAPPHSRSSSVAVAAANADASPPHRASDAVVPDFASQVAVVVRAAGSLSAAAAPLRAEAARAPLDRGPA